MLNFIRRLSFFKISKVIPQEALRVAFGVVLLYVGFMFVLAPGEQQTAVALPAGIAALFLAILAWVLRRKVLKRPARHAPPGDDVEYHL